MYPVHRGRRGAVTQVMIKGESPANVERRTLNGIKILAGADQMAAVHRSFGEGGGRKVRAPQGMVLDNVQRGQPQG